MAKRGFVVWFTGLPCSGKSTIAEALEVELERRGIRIEILDGDVVRTNLSKGLGFSKEDRDINIRRIAFVANLIARNGGGAVTAAISPYRAIRAEARALVEGDGSEFIEVYVATPAEVCEKRDVKGMWAKARAGEIKEFTGVDDPYEPPDRPEVVCHTQAETVDESMGKVLRELEARGCVPSEEGLLGPIAPHGGFLVDRLAPADQVEALLAEAAGLPRIVANPVIARDIEMIGVGAFSPLTGFMGEADYQAVVETGRLAKGLPWTVPITCDLGQAKVETGGKAAIVDDAGNILATIDVTDVFRRDAQREAAQVYRTTDAAHPGVARIYAESNTLVGGSITVLRRCDRSPFEANWADPRETRATFRERGWKRIVAFQTRNPIHRAHEYLQKCALEMCDGLMIHPIVGDTKSDDIPAEVRMDCYEALIDNYFPRDRVLLRVLPTAMRYAGPKEAIFHAIMRKNYGCTHFIVGRDHAGVGNYYGTFDAHLIFEEYDPQEIGISPLFFDHAFYCLRTKGMASQKTSPSSMEERVFLSGTKVRELLSAGEDLPEEFTRPEVSAVLKRAYSK